MHTPDPTTAAPGNHVTRVLRHTPLSTLIRSRAQLIQTLVAVPELHDRLRHGWSREDPVLTAHLFSWVEQSRLHSERSDGLDHSSANWMRDLEMAA